MLRGDMKPIYKAILFWTPRILGLLFAAFLGLFAIDAFGESHGLWNTALALALHLVPAALVLAALAVAWRWEWPGALLFFGLGSAYTLKALEHPSWILAIAGPAFLVGGLFLLNWLCSKRPRAVLPQ